MGGLFESKQKTTSQQSTQVPLNFSQLMDRTISFANEGLDTPFQAYNAPRIADLSANEQAGISAAGAQAGMYQPLIDMAMTNNADMQARGGIPTAGDLNQFINPYVDYVLGNSLDRLQEQSDTNMTKIGSTAAMSGAFGGLRHGVLEGANLAELLKSARDLSASTYSDAYDKGMGNWFRSQDLRRGTIRDALDITGQGSAYNKSDINALMQTGLVGRTRDQSVLDFAFSEFMREQQDPFTKAGFASSILSSYPTNLFTRNTKSETTSTPSPFSQIAGVGLAAAGLMTGNPAALAGLGAGASSLGSAGIGASNIGSEGWFLDDVYKHNIGRAKGGLIKGYKKGGKVKGYKGGGHTKGQDQFFSDDLFDALMRVQQHENAANEYELPFYREGFKKENPTELDFIDILDALPGDNLTYSNLPRFYSDGPFEEKQKEFTKDVGSWLDERGMRRKILDDKIRSTNYLNDPLSDKRLKDAITKHMVESQSQAEWIKEWAPKAHKELADMTTRTDPLDDFLIPDGDFQRQYTHTLSSGPTGKKKKYSYGGQVNNSPATMVEAFNSPQYQTQGGYKQGSLFGFSIFDAIFGRGAYSPNERQVRTGSTPAPYTPKPQTPYDWSSFYERQGLNRIPTAQSRINPNYASGARPDLSMFIQMLQERLGGQQGGGGQLPTPPFQQGFAKGGQVKAFNGGGIIEDITHLLDIAPRDRGWKKEYEEDRDPLFMPTQEAYGGGNTLPISDLLDMNRVFRLGVQQHETSTAKDKRKYDDPNYFANSFKGAMDSHAFGLGQWQPGTWNTLAKRWNKENPKNPIRMMSQDDVKQDRLPTKKEQDNAWSIWEQDLLKSQKGDYARAFAEHQLGIGDMFILSRANPNQLMRKLPFSRGGERIAKNVSAYDPKSGRDETVAQYLNRLRGMIDSAKNWEVDRLKRKGGVATDIERKSPTFVMSNDKEFNDKYYPQPLLEKMLRASGVDPNAFSRKGDMVITPSDITKSLTTGANFKDADNSNTLIMDYLPERRDNRVGRATAKSSKPKTFNSPLDIVVTTPKKDYLASRIHDPSYYPGVSEEDFLPELTRGGRQIISQNDIARMLKDSGIDYQPFRKKKKYNGGGYVKKFAKGQIVETDPYAPHSTDEDVLYKFNQGAPSFNDWLEQAWERIKRPAFGPPPQGNTPQRHISKGNVSPFGSLNMGILTPDNQGTSPEDFNSALENGEPSDIVSKPAQEQLQEDSLTTALKAMIMQEIEDRKSRKEPGPPTLFGREINMPLLKMGLGILANSGYPNSAGEAIGKGVLGALNEEEEAQLAKSKRNNDKLKELLNLRYMQGMVESMDPNIKMQLQRERAAQETTQKAIEKQQEYELRMALWEAQRQGKVEDALAIVKGKLDAENQALFGIMGEDEGINVD